MSIKPFDPTKPVQTRDGRKVRVLCTDRKGVAEKIVTLTDEGTKEALRAYYSDGKYYEYQESLFDLVNVSEKHTVFLCMHSNGTLSARKTREEAVTWANGVELNGGKCFAIKEVELTEGEGVT